MLPTRLLLVLVVCLPARLGAAPPPTAAPKPSPSVHEKIREVAGTAEFLRAVPKHFATLQAVDPAQRRVTLLVEGEKLPKVWQLTPDAEVKVDGWWGRLDQLTAGDRVWAWFFTDRHKRPVGVAMLADEPSEQDIHGQGLTLVRVGPREIVVRPVKGPERTLAAAMLPAGLVPGKPVYVQSSGARARRVLTAEQFAAGRAAQQAALRKRWQTEGLPGTISVLHRFSGEMEVLLDHEAMRWARALQLGDKVRLAAHPPIPAVVRHVRPWRERTQLRLVVNGFDQAELVPGQRIRLLVPVPAATVADSPLPPDLDRPRSKEERVEWFLATIYCTCKVKGDGCTGHFYTLASCNPNGCGMPQAMRAAIRAQIDRGRTDRQILDELLRKHGPDLLRPHLLP